MSLQTLTSTERLMAALDELERARVVLDRRIRALRARIAERTGTPPPGRPEPAHGTEAGYYAHKRGTARTPKTRACPPCLDAHATAERERKAEALAAKGTWAEWSTRARAICGAAYPEAVRVWARANNLEAPTRSKLPAELLAAYVRANEPTTSTPTEENPDG